MHETEPPGSLMVLPCQLNDVGSQRCWLGTSMMSKLNILLYDVVQIECTDTLSFLCRAWPRLDKVDSRYIQFDGTVLATDAKQYEKVLDCVDRIVSVAMYNVQKVMYSVVESVSVTVVVTDWREFALCRKRSTQAVQCQVRNLLFDFVIAASHIVLCSRSSLGKLYCWDRVIVHDVTIKNNCICGFIASSCRINVVDVISKDRYIQHTQASTVLGGLDNEINLLCSVVLQSQEYGFPGSSRKQVSFCYTSCARGRHNMPPPSAS